MNIDWSKAPEGATHYGAATYSNGSPDWCEAFYRQEMGGFWRICFPESSIWHGDASRNSDWKERFATLTARPAAWNGEGLPPVGIDCDTLWSSSTGEYVQVKVLAHDEDRAVVRFLTGSRKGEYDSDTQHTRYGASLPIFRPLSTPKQIAAEEREKAAAAMSNATQGAKDWAEAFRMLHDAGYRKFQMLRKTYDQSRVDP